MRGRYAVLVLIVTVSLVQADTTETSTPASQPGLNAPRIQISVSGKVADSHGKPVAGAGVTLYGMTYSGEASSPKVEVIQEEATGADGAFRLAGVQGVNPYRQVFLIARREGLALGWATWRMQAGQRHDIVLGEPKDLVGEIVDEKGEPIAEAEIGIALAVMGTAEDCRLLAAPSLLNTRTDNNGRFCFANMPAEATFEFLVHKRGRVMLSTLAQALFSDSSSALSIRQIASGARRCQFSPGQTGIKLTLPSAARIEGVVIEKSSGKPIGGVQVTTRNDVMKGGYVPPDPVTTAEDGTFHMDGVAAGNGSVQLATTRGRMADWVAEPVPLALKADETKSGVKLELTKGGVIEVLVREAGGKPIGKAGVQVSHMQRKQYFGGNTDENGLVRVRVPSGPYHVSEPFKPGYALQIGGEQVTIEGGQTKRVEFILPVAPRVAGTVRDAAGNPLAGVRMTVTPVGMMGTVTNADGEFALDWSWGLPAFQDTVPVLVARDVARNLAEIVEIGQQTGRLDLRLKSGVIVVGTVQNQEGKPLSGARILLVLRLSSRSGPSGLIDQVTTDAKGTFEIKAIPPGRQYELMATANGYGMHHVSVDVSNLKDNRQDIGQFMLGLANLSISGVVVDSQDKPITGAMVSAVDGSIPPRADVQTDAEGKFVIQEVPAGPTLLMAYTTGSPRLHGLVEADGGATGVRIVVSE